MGVQYRCRSEQRHHLVRDQKPPKINGIDFLEVDDSQKLLYVHFIHTLPKPSDSNVKDAVPANGAELAADNVRIEGGVRIRNIHVIDAKTDGKVLTVTADAVGDYSAYTLRLVDPNSDPPPGMAPDPPSGFDLQLAAVPFSFKAGCSSDFDCKSVQVCPPTPAAEPAIDYLAKDYASFRRLMLDRLALLMPEWKERNPADLQIALLELLAYTSDYLSYYQDAVAKEAYLGTARQRVSVRRHARLLDYRMHDGCNARVWVHVRAAADNLSLPEGTVLLTRVPGLPSPIASDSPAYANALEAGAMVFETMHNLTLFKLHESMPFYTWGNLECCLPRGATTATLDGAFPNLHVGDVLIFEEILSPTTGDSADADPSHRHAVRLTQVVGRKDVLANDRPVTEIFWDHEDALPFPLCLSSTRKGFGLPNVSVVHGNVVLADHGRSLPRAALNELPEHLAPVPKDGPYRPLLTLAPVTQQARVRERGKRNPALVPVDLSAPASAAMHWDFGDVLPVITLADPTDPDRPWKPQRDLLASDRFAREFVVEVEQDNTARLRFGDDVMGGRPEPQTSLQAMYRVGNGRVGNIGRESIAHVITDLAVDGVRNPMPAQGGTEPEDMEKVRLYAPSAFRRQERAVVADDYATMAERHPEVQKAAATIRWTGSWYTVFVTIDRRGGQNVDSVFRSEILSYLERFRLAGFDVEVNSPFFVSLDLAMQVCAQPCFFNSDVKHNLLQAFSSRDLPGGGRGFFHHDNFTFAQAVYLSRIYETAMQVAGVASVNVTRFQRWGRKPAGELDKAVLKPERLEIIRLDNDLNFPENGRLEINVQGGA